MTRPTLFLCAMLALGACDRRTETAVPAPERTSPPAAPVAPAPLPAPPIDDKSAEAAMTVLRSYYALLEAGRYGEAWRFWSDGGRASGMDEAAFAASFARYAEHHAEIGAPGPVEGAAGSLYVEAPVRIHGRLKSGEPFEMEGPVSLRRVNDVPGATAEQLSWRIASSGVKPRPRQSTSARTFYLGRWAARPELCRDGAWVFSERELNTAGEVHCRFDQVRDTAQGVEIDALCTAQAPPERHTLRLAYAESARALLVEGGPFADVGLVRCP